MKYLSTFSGVGGFEKALPEGWECVGQSEIDKYAAAVLKYRFPTVKNYGDITKIDWATVPDFDLLVGGSPCQDLSVAGKRAGLGGSRSGLFAHYIKALEEKQPAHFIWENVKGALSSNGGKDFAAILSAFSQAGYSLWWQVLNAKDFGVPQNRERVFVVGTRNGSAREILFERAVNDPSNKQQQEAGEAIATTLRAKRGGPDIDQTYITAPTLRANHHNTADVHFIDEPPQLRRLTPRECERLMSWPDDWTRYGDFNGEVKEISDTQRYKMCGNGVVSQVVKAVVDAHLS